MQNLHMQNLHLRNCEQPHTCERGGKDFDLCKMGVYLGVYLNISKIKLLINIILNLNFDRASDTAFFGGYFFA